MCSLVCLKQLPALPTPSKHLQEPAAGFLPVLELLAIPVPNPAQRAAKSHPRAPGSAGEGSAPHLPDVLCSKSYSTGMQAVPKDKLLPSAVIAGLCD